MGIGGVVMMLVFWALLVAGIVVLVGWLRRKDFPAQRETPLDILKKRYAQGEIGKDEFDRMKKDLES
ncbi:MAG: SHOCT domain-containing protein [Desulfobulbia bacterium]